MITDDEDSDEAAIAEHKDNTVITKDKDKAPPFVVKTPDAFVIFDVAVGNQDLFVRRRKPQDSLEMQQMKVCVCVFIGFKVGNGF